MQIQMVDLQRQYQQLKPEIDAAVMEVIESGKFINGPAVQAFKHDVETYLGSGHVISCASGTDALQLALMGIGIQPGDEIITTPLTFVATSEAIVVLGAKPVFVDIDEKSYNINPDLVEAAITEKTKAIIPVHLYGQAADMDPLMDIARRHNLTVIEDAAQAFGGTYKGRKICAIGDLACVSFYPGKNLGAYGDGGMVVARDEAMAHKIQMIADHGSQVRYLHEEIGVNSRLDSIQAAVLRCKLPHLDAGNARRREIAKMYDERLPGDKLIKPTVMDYGEHIFHQYTLRTPHRDAIQTYLKERNIPTAIHYPRPLHLQPAFKKVLPYSEGQFPLAEKVASEVFSVPMHPHLMEEEVDAICTAITDFFKENDL